MVLNNNTPQKEIDIKEINFNIVQTLCNTYMGLSPFEVLNAPLDEVMDLYVDAIIRHEKRNKNKNTKTNNNDAVWVNSKTATWH